MRLITREEANQVGGGITKIPVTTLPPTGVTGYYTAPLNPGEIIVGNYHQPGIGGSMTGRSGTPFGSTSPEFAKLYLPYHSPDGLTYNPDVFSGLTINGDMSGTSFVASASLPISVSTHAFDFKVTGSIDAVTGKYTAVGDVTYTHNGVQASFHFDQAQLKGSTQFTFGPNNEYYLGLLIEKPAGKGWDGMLTLGAK